jgi:hypothetical protein
LFGVRLFENVLLLPTPAAVIYKVLLLPLKRAMLRFKLVTKQQAATTRKKRQLDADASSQRVACSMIVSVHVHCMTDMQCALPVSCAAYMHSVTLK